MSRWLVLIVVACLALTGCSSNSTDGGLRTDYQLADLAWMAGSWRSVDLQEGHTTISEEHWTDGSGGTMFGVNRLIADDHTAFFEFLRIEADDDGKYYIAQPRGRSPGTRFELIESTRRRAVFENQEHDFPQRIIYQREGDTLTARVEGDQGGELRFETWVWQRVEDDD